MRLGTTKLKRSVTKHHELWCFRFELEPGIEGLRPRFRNEADKKNVPPGKIVSTSQGSGSSFRSRSRYRKNAAFRWASKGSVQPLGPTLPIRIRSQHGLKAKSRTPRRIWSVIGLERHVDGMVHMSDIRIGAFPAKTRPQLSPQGEQVKAIVLEHLIVIRNAFRSA